jgi:hypothetical protein
MRRLAKLAVALFALALTWQPASAWASEWSFNAPLSLTGNCSTSPADPTADPGLCPMPPGVAGIDHPSLPFTRPEGVATDSFGDIYVSSFGNSAAGGAEGRIDIFSPGGFFISELKDGNGPRALAVDGEGGLYIYEVPFSGGSVQIRRCAPTTYEPPSGEIDYGICSVAVESSAPPFSLPTSPGFALDPTNGHLFVDYETFIAEYGSVEEGHPLLDDEIGKGTLAGSKWVAPDAAHGRIYASDSDAELFTNGRVRVFELAKPHALLETITGCGSKAFASPGGELALAADESNGHFFVGDLLAKSRVQEFDEGYECLATIEHSPSFQDAGPSAISVDNSAASPNYRDLFVTSGIAGIGHSYVFEPQEAPPPPHVEVSVGEIGESEAQLQAMIAAGGAESHFTFEYTTEQNFEEEGFAAAVLAGEGDVPAGSEEAHRTALAAGLQPGTAYRFRLRVVSEVGSDEAEAAFGTFPEGGPFGQPCPNAALRVGSSKTLPDCRVYELVTPADTNGHTPLGAKGNGAFFSPTLLASPEGEKATFTVQGGALPDSDGTGAFNGENYLATRTASGWETSIAGPSGAESQAAVPGSPSPDQGYSFWATGSESDEGSAVINGENTNYLRYPDGHSELVGRGSLGIDPQVTPNLITEGARHVVFTTTTLAGHIPVQLEEDAAPEGTRTVYDRTIDPVTHAEETRAVSLLPGEVPAGEGEAAEYVGASPEGAGIAFSIANRLYLRLNDKESFEIGEGTTFAGIVSGGRRIFYVKGSDLFAFDTESEATTPFTASGDATVVNVAAEGSRAYFVSPSKLTGEEAPNGGSPVEGGQNLYLSEEGAISFLGILTDRDVKGGTAKTDGLGLWTAGIAVIEGTPIDPSRTTPDGAVLLFESRADLAGFKSGGKAQVYRYDQAADSLRCLSCSPSLQMPGGDASLQSNADDEFPKNPLGFAALVSNLRPDGARAFFQSPEPLVAADTDKVQDVYEWEEEGVGSCSRLGGCVYLISSGHSPDDNFLYGASVNGNDVFFIGSDALLARDTGEIPSIYDARVGGGFAEAETVPCQGEGCRPGASTPPPLPNLGSQGAGPPFGNVAKPKHCPKAKRKVKRHGKVLCVKKRIGHRKHSAGGKRRAGK